MNAVEFVRKFGWEGAISFTNWYGGNTAFKFLKVKEKTISVHSGDQPYDFHINDLKRLVESWELVGRLGGLEKCKGYVQVCFYKGRDQYGNRIKQAIADVESVGGGCEKD